MRNDVSIDWSVPPASPGWSGRLERFMGPGKRPLEYIVEFAGGAVCVALLGWHVWHAGTYREWSLVQSAVAALIGLDLVGGVLTNSTNAAKRWYHRNAAGMSRSRLTFVGMHVLHLAGLAFLLRPGVLPTVVPALPPSLGWVLVNSGLLLALAVLIESVPLEVKRPTAMGAYMAALLVNATLFPLPAAVGLFVAFFYLKLLIGHLVPEAPMVGRHEHA